MMRAAAGCVCTVDGCWCDECCNEKVKRQNSSGMFSAVSVFTVTSVT